MALSRKTEKKKGNDGEALRWIYSCVKRYIPIVVIVTLLSMVTAFGYVALAVISKWVLDVATGNKEGKLVFYGVLLMATVGVLIIASAVESYLRAVVSAKLTISTRNRIFSSISRRKYSDMTSYHSGELMNRMTSDVEVITSSVIGVIPSIAAMFTKIIGGVATLLVLDWRIALLILVIGFTVPLFGRIFNKKFKSLHKETQRSEGKTRSFMQECFENLSVIKTFGSEGPFSRKLNEYMKNNYRLKMKKTKYSVTISIGLFAFFTIGYYFVLLWGADSIAKGMITYGTLMAFLQLVEQLRAPLQSISGILPQYYTSVASAERLIEVEKGEVDKLPDTEAVNKLKESFKSIEFNNVCFKYGSEPVLVNCSFSANAGQITALTGESGSGKSTSLKLIAGLYAPQTGSITFNGDIPLDTSLRGMFAYVPQGNMVLSGTVRDNITLCDTSISEDEVIRAAKSACIYDIIKDLPDGFDTVLTERGGGLSEGQIQRIAIARALLTDAPILLLDEATSDLDEVTEAQLLANIKAMKEKTVLFITHRNTSLKVCDRIIHMENGTYTTIKE